MASDRVRAYDVAGTYDGNPDTTGDPGWQPLSIGRNGNRFSPP